ncbi:MAG: cache domain-containing protein, partial [Oscillospiraceae bacterium]|nr:cache domain-containing protein [Oscillospiraceae bacterium]
MKIIRGIKFGGLQQKIFNLMLVFILVLIGVYAAVSVYQQRALTKVVQEASASQQASIEAVSEETMRAVLDASMTQSTALQANVADNDFAEVVNNVSMLQTIAQGLFENRDSLLPVAASLPDPSLDGSPSAMVLCEEGVDYTQSEYLGVAAHMSSPMLAMLRNSDKIDGLYIGLADGTDLCVDEKSAIKLDENGDLIPFPVRQRPWYTGAVEAGGVYFTGIVPDAFSGRLLVTCSAPVVANGELIGVVGIDIVLESMSDYQSAASEGSTVFIVNDSGQVIISSDRTGIFAAGESDTAPDLRTLGNEELARFLDQALTETTEIAVVTLDGRPYYMAGSPMPTVGWAVVTAVDKEITHQPTALMLSQYDEINDDALSIYERGAKHSGQTILLLTVLIL